MSSPLDVDVWAAEPTLEIGRREGYHWRWCCSLPRYLVVAISLELAVYIPPTKTRLCHGHGHDLVFPAAPVSTTFRTRERRGSNPKAVRDSLYEVSGNAANASAVKYCTCAPILEDIMYLDGV